VSYRGERYVLRPKYDPDESFSDWKKLYSYYELIKKPRKRKAWRRRQKPCR
ncbi:hypothetical protein THOM_2064, partial [Trachipleistophora hominis]